MTEAFRYLFLAALALTLILKLWLGWRHIRHIARHRARVPAEFADAITLQQHQHAADYSMAKTRLGLLSSCVDTALIAGLTLGGVLDWLARQISSLALGEIGSGLLLVVAMTLLSSAISLPISLYSTFRIEARFGFNKMTLAMFVLDAIKGSAIGALIGLPLLALVLWLMAQAGPLWWLWVWLVWSVFQLLMVALYPTLIAPLFNRFQPLEDLELKQRIEALLARTGFTSQGVFVMDGSRRSSHGNAYFTGFGGRGNRSRTGARTGPFQAQAHRQAHRLCLCPVAGLSVHLGSIAACRLVLPGSRRQYAQHRHGTDPVLPCRAGLYFPADTAVQPAVTSS